MSTSRLSAPSSARRKVASPTHVAPCRRCAGPKTSPRKLWATIMWSRTVTLNTGSLSAVGDEVAQRRKGTRGEPAEHLGELLEPGRAGDQRVEPGVAQQVQGERQAVRVGPA